VAEALSITDILGMHPDELAGGQKQRVSLARALVREPTVFLMDEPLSHVDADVRYRARAEIKHIQTAASATVIYVTHDQIEAVALADRVVVMDLGVIQQIGSPSELYFKPANLFVAGFIGEPPMNLIHAKVELAGDQFHITGGSSGAFSLHFAREKIPSASLDMLGKFNNGEMVIGVRPQKLTVGPFSEAAGDGVLRGKLLVHEFLGKEGVAQIEIDGLVLECMTASELPFNRGDSVAVSLEFADIHFFDPTTTRRIDCEASSHGNPGA
jgi:ABC-type sugar transport system ATPase subunit